MGKFGIFYIEPNRMEEKRYGYLFACVNMRADHVESGSSLSTDSLQILMHFTSRRGQPQITPSDNSSNFTGAWTKIYAVIQILLQNNVFEYYNRKE